MSEGEPDFFSTEVKAWISTLCTKSWFEVVTNNHDDLSTSYFEVISEFATLLQEKISKVAPIHSNPADTLGYMETLKSNLPKMMQNLDQPRDFLDVSPSMFRQRSEEVASNLFSRVLAIFNRNNRSVNDLYSDMDINKDGKINFEEMRTEFLKYDNSITLEESQAVFEILDGNNDGSVSLHELTKRMKLIHEKAELETRDPLACYIISKPLDPDKIHGNLAVILVNGEGLKPGAHSVKIKIADFLEYLTPDSTDPNPFWNFRADFFFENKVEKELPLFVDIELNNKKLLEGIGSFQWKKAMNTPNDFSAKQKVIIKTSTGHFRGNLYFQIMWTPIYVRVYNEDRLRSNRGDDLEEFNSYNRRQDSDELFSLSDEDDNEYLPLESKRTINELPKGRPVDFKKADTLRVSPYEKKNIKETGRDKSADRARSKGLSNEPEVRNSVQRDKSTEVFKKVEVVSQKSVEKWNELSVSSDLNEESKSVDVRPSRIGRKRTEKTIEEKKSERSTNEYRSEIEKKESRTETPSRQSLHPRNSSYSYLMKVSSVTVEEVVKKSLKPPSSIPGPGFNIVIKSRKVIDPSITPLPKGVASKIPTLFDEKN